MIFLDTSAIYALADASDLNHTQASALFQQLLIDHEQLLTSSYVLVEASALIQRRLGLNPALRFLRESQAFEIYWIGSSEHMHGADLLESQGSRQLSLVDCVSFALMRHLSIQTAFAFGPDFQRAGFLLYAAS